MNWEQKTEMIKASNQGDFLSFKNVVTENIDKFDAQAWDMFLNSTEFIEADMANEIIFWQKVWSYYLLNKPMIEKDTSFRAVMRSCILETMMEDSSLISAALISAN